MRRRRYRNRGSVPALFAALTALGLMSNACSGEAEGPLGEALSFAPAEARVAEVTDVASVLELGGEPPVEADFEDKQEYVVDLGPAGQALDADLLQPELKEKWGFDLLDLEWQARIDASYALKFRDDFDFGPLKTRFEECDFEAEERDDAVVYSRELDLQDECFADEFGLGPPTQIANTALFEDERVALMASEPDALDSMLAAKSDDDSLAGVEAYSAAAGQVDDADAVTLLSSASTCAPMARVPPAIQEELLSRYGGRRYETMALGTTYEEDGSSGRIVLHYEDSDDAEAELGQRTTALEEGTSLVTRQSYSDLLRVEDSNVEGGDIVIDVSPVEEGFTLQRMAAQGDFGFALCREDA